MQKIILINDIQNNKQISNIQNEISTHRQNLKNALIIEQDYIISEILKLQKQYFKCKAEDGYFFLFDNFLLHSKLSINIIFDYLYKKDNSIRINRKGVKMLLNFCYELITENKNKCNEELTFQNLTNHPDCYNDIPQNIIMLKKEDFVDNKKTIQDDDDDELGWMPNKKNKYKEANEIYYLLIQFLLQSIKDEIDPVWSWQ